MEVVQAVWMMAAIFLVLCMVLAVPFGFVWNRAVVAAFNCAKPIDYWTSFLLVVVLMIVLGRFDFGVK